MDVLFVDCDMRFVLCIHTPASSLWFSLPPLIGLCVCVLILIMCFSLCVCLSLSLSLSLSLCLCVCMCVGWCVDLTFFHIHHQNQTHRDSHSTASTQLWSVDMASQGFSFFLFSLSLSDHNGSF